MNVSGDFVLAVARATSKPDDVPANRWMGYVHVRNRGSFTVLEAADGDIAARIELDKDTRLASCISRENARRLNPKDEVHFDTQVRQGAMVDEVTSPFTLGLERDDGKGIELPECPYPDLDALVYSKRPAFAAPVCSVNVALLKRALSILEDCGATDALFVVPKREEDPIFVLGVTDTGRDVQCAVRRASVFGRKAKTPDVTAPTAAAPLLDGATPAPPPAAA